jgi:hypothetical protein
MYEIEKDKISLFYNYEDKLLNEEETNWHLKENNNKEILSKKYNTKIRKGAILVQVSSDGKNFLQLPMEYIYPGRLRMNPVLYRLLQSLRRTVILLP